MKATFRAMCNGCGRIIRVGEDMMLDVHIAPEGTWASFRHPQCRVNPAVISWFPAM